MKNKYSKLLLVLGSIFTLGANAQIIEKLDYIGALSPDPSKDWTKNWTNWTPKTTNYAAATDLTTLDASSTGSKHITSNLTLDASKVYLLKGIIVVDSGYTLTIPAGTLIRSEADLNASPKNYATIVISRGAKIDVQGTSANPVVMTSNKSTRERGDWGGLVICGRAKNNQGNFIQLEGFNNVTFDNQLGRHGAGDDADNSGTISYLRIEFAGLAFEANKEVNALTMGSVGSGTKIDHVQCSYGGDDAYEWFGGTVNCRYLISYKTTDDDFDTDFGYRGVVQNGIAQRDTAYFDLSWNAPSGASTSESFESDNDAAGSAKQPYTNAIFCNMTVVGPVPIGSRFSKMPTLYQNAFRRGARIRRNSRLSIVNSIFMGYRNFVMFDGDSTLKHSGVMDSVFNNTASSMLFRRNIIVNSDSAASAGSTANGLVEVASANSAYLNKFTGWLKASSNSNKINPVAYAASTLLVDPQNKTNPDFKPVTAAASLVGDPIYDAYNALLSKGIYNHVFKTNAQIAMEVYPNPAKSELNIQVSAPIVSAQIMDLTGRVVLNVHSSELNANRISVEAIQNGTYYLLIQTTAGSATQLVQISK